MTSLHKIEVRTDSRIPKHQSVKVLYRENAIIGAHFFYKKVFIHSCDYAVPTGDKWQSKTLFLVMIRIRRLLRAILIAVDLVWSRQFSSDQYS